MEIRRSKRLIVRLDAEIIVDGSTCTGFIGNLSREGIYMKITSPAETIDFNPGKVVDLKFRLPSGQVIGFPCRIKWSNRVLPENLIYSVGMEVINAPQKYKELLTGRVQF